MMTSNEFPRPDLAMALADLQHSDAYKVVLSEIRHEREQCFGDLREAKDANEVMRITGGIVKLDEILRSFSV